MRVRGALSVSISHSRFVTIPVRYEQAHNTTSCLFQPVRVFLARHNRRPPALPPPPAKQLPPKRVRSGYVVRALG